MASETILIVDDSQEIVSFLKNQALPPLDVNIITASNGRTGLDLALEHSPDLILLDMSMPHMTGMEMLLALRQTLCPAPVIFMTMFGSENIAVEAFRLGVKDYLAKPFTVEQVQKAVERALRESRLAQERDALLRDLVTSETIRRTVVTLAHYINNDLFVVNGGLSIVAASMEARDFDENRLLSVITDSRASLNRISAVIRVLQKIIRAEPATYHAEIKMIDIENALKEEMGKST